MIKYRITVCPFFIFLRQHTFSFNFSRILSQIYRSKIVIGKLRITVNNHRIAICISRIVINYLIVFWSSRLCPFDHIDRQERWHLAFDLIFFRDLIDTATCIRTFITRSRGDLHGFHRLFFYIFRRADQYLLRRRIRWMIDQRSCFLFWKFFLSIRGGFIGKSLPLIIST